MEDDLICNYKKCRKRLTTVAWITSCSHVFCEEDGTREFGKQAICPACENPLSAQYDLIKIDLQPSEQYKSMVLAGLRPEIIMEICTRAMSFWTYQSHQERSYQEYLATKAVERAQQQEAYYDQLMASHQSEVTALRNQVISLKRDLENIKTRYNETSEKLMEKSRQYQKLQGVYEALRRRTITPASFEKESIGRGNHHNMYAMEHPLPFRQHPPLAPGSFELPLGSISNNQMNYASLPPGPAPPSLPPHSGSVGMAQPQMQQVVSATTAPVHLDHQLASAVSGTNYHHHSTASTGGKGQTTDQRFTIKLANTTSHHHPRK